MPNTKHGKHTIGDGFETQHLIDGGYVRTEVSDEADADVYLNVSNISSVGGFAYVHMTEAETVAVIAMLEVTLDRARERAGMEALAESVERATLATVDAA